MSNPAIEALLRSPSIQNLYVSFCANYGKEVGDRYLDVLASETASGKSIGSRSSPQKRPSGAYAEETKQKIREAIASLGECRRAQINDRLLRMHIKLSQSEMEWFLKTMREEGLIRARNAGRTFIYFVEKEAIAS